MSAVNTYKPSSTSTHSDVAQGSVITATNADNSTTAYHNTTQIYDNQIDAKVSNLRSTQILSAHIKDKTKIVDGIKANRYNTLRQAQFDTYDAKKYKAHGDIIKTLIYIVILMIINLALKNRGLVPANISNGISTVICVVGLALTARDVFDVMMRDNMDYDSYSWAFNSANNDPTVYENDKAQIKKIMGIDGAAVLPQCYNGNCCADDMTFVDGKCTTAVAAGAADATNEGFGLLDSSNDRVASGAELGGGGMVAHATQRFSRPTTNTVDTAQMNPGKPSYGPAGVQTNCSRCTGSGRIE